MSEVTVKLKALSVREKEYLNKYQKLYIKLYTTSEKLEGALEVLALDFEDLDCIKLQEIIETFVEAKYLNKITTHHDDFLLDDFVKIFKENIVRPKINLLLKFPANSNSFSYLDLKYRSPYLIARGDDGYLRLFRYDSKKEQLIYLKEILAEVLHYDLLDNYLFISQANKLIVIDLETDYYVAEKEFSSINGIEYKNNKIFIITDKFSQGVSIKNKQLIWEEASVDKIESSYQDSINLGSFFIFFKSFLLSFSKDNNFYSILYDTRKYKYLFIKEGNNLIKFDLTVFIELLKEKFYKIKENLEETIDKYLKENFSHIYQANSDIYSINDLFKDNNSYDKFFHDLELAISKNKIFFIIKSENYFQILDSLTFTSLDNFYDNLVERVRYIISDQSSIKINKNEFTEKISLDNFKNMYSKENFLSKKYKNQNPIDFRLLNIKRIILLEDIFSNNLYSIKDNVKIETIYSKQIKPLVGYIKNDNYLTLVFYDSLTHYKFEKEGAKAILDLTGKELKRKEGLNKTIPNNLRMYLFEDGFIILKDNKVYGTENWKDYVQFVEGLEVKEYSKWESYYDNAWCPELFEEL